MIKKERWTITDVATGETQDFDGWTPETPGEYRVKVEMVSDREHSWKEELEPGCVESHLYVDGKYSGYFLLRHHVGIDWHIHKASCNEQYRGINIGSNENFEYAKSVLIREWEKQNGQDHQR